MDSQLPEEILNKLLPILKHLAEFISKGIMPKKYELEVILKSIGLEGEAKALTELQLWGKILEKARNNPDNPDRAAIITELQNRGIPEFPAILAYEEAKPAEPFSVEPQLINFVCLKHGEGATATLKVSGRLVNVVVSDHRLKVTLLKASSGTILVKVQLPEGKAGESLKSEIILRGDRGELRVPVAAQWEKAAPEKPVTPLRNKATSEPPLLSWCPDCAERIKKKSLFYNRYTQKYECFNCKHIFLYPDKRVSQYNDTHD